MLDKIKEFFKIKQRNIELCEHNIDLKNQVNDLNEALQKAINMINKQEEVIDDLLEDDENTENKDVPMYIPVQIAPYVVKYIINPEYLEQQENIKTSLESILKHEYTKRDFAFLIARREILKCNKENDIRIKPKIS